MKKIFPIFWQLIEATSFSLGIFVVTYSFLFQVTQVHGSSSFPTIKDDDRLITNRIVFTFSDPKRFEFVIVKSPTNPDIELIKRVIGLPNETIELKNGTVYINDLKIEEYYLTPGTQTHGEAFLSDGTKVEIPNNSYFVLGDNRNNSSDSRQFGPISKDQIVGRVDVRYWPPEDFQLLLP